MKTKVKCISCKEDASYYPAWFDSVGPFCYACTEVVLRSALKYVTAKAGKTKSAAKAKAARENGKLGGRPRKG